MSTTKPLIETAQFIQHHLPGLDAGEYALEVKHEFASDGTSDTDIPGGKDITDSLWYKFAVQGPQFSLDPTVVQSVFPPDGSLGEFSNVLPHVVLTKETLPWLRKPVGGKTDLDTGAFPDDQHVNHDLDIPSWLAVMIFTEADFTPLELKNTTVSTFFKAVDENGDAFISPVYGDTMDNQPPWFNPNDPCQAIKIPIGVFSSMAPSLADLFMMANVRKVEMGSKPASPGADINDLGTYSIVMGNRIPVAGQRHLAVLVSLENMADFLPDHNGVASPSITSDIKNALLPVLANWRFISDGDSYRFDHLLKSLNGAVPTDSVGLEALPNARLKMYPKDGATPPAGAASDAINLGYIPVQHSTRNGVTTASWYRGPLAPYAFNPDNAKQALNLLKTQNGVTTPAVYDADALLRLDPATGLFDVSYASAWQLGRLLALQDKSNSINMYQWKRTNASSVVLNMEAGIIEETFKDILNNAGITDVTDEDNNKKTLLQATMAELIRRTKNS